MRRKKLSLLIGVVLFILALGLVPAMIGAQGRSASQRIESDQASFRLVRAADGLRNPWGMDFLPDGGILITERPGQLRIWRDGRLSTVSGLPEIYASGQGGLLDIAVHPDFEKN
ncbi:MAG: PQQ-dependent sugar dehydrogenase, partial [Sediminispirochaetaceae bacterium]